MSAYPRTCNSCGQSILMAEAFPGHWQPWEPDGSGRHKCGSGKQITQASNLPAKTDPETYLTRCLWCRQHVYYHTNGHGDSVLFDSLGWPWQVHPCWTKFWRAESDRRKVLNSLAEPENLDSNKRLVLLGAIRKIEGARIKNNCCYGAHEKNISIKLGLSVQQLRDTYGHLYTVKPQGICLKLTLDHSKIIKIVSSTSSEFSTCPYCKIRLLSSKLKSHLRAHKLLMSKPTALCPVCGITTLKSKLQEHVKAAHRKALIQCPHCRQRIRQDRLEKHIQKVHAHLETSKC